MGMPKEKDLNGKINTGKKYYRGMNIKYVACLQHTELFFLLSFCFISTDKVLIHCCDGVSHSLTLFLAYLTIHRDTMVKESIDCIIKV